MSVVPTKTYDDLKIDTLLSPGQSVAIGCSDRTRGLGEQFFAADPDEQEPRLLLVVRLQQTQLDDRFMDDESSSRSPRHRLTRGVGFPRTVRFRPAARGLQHVRQFPSAAGAGNSSSFAGNLGRTAFHCDERHVAQTERHRPGDCGFSLPCR